MSSTNLNIRISSDLKARLDDFARQHHVPVTSLLINEIELLLAHGRPPKSIITPTLKLNRAVSRTAERTK